MPTTTVELLAPARDAEVGRAAIDCGADAVYIGPERFGARQKAGNDLASVEALASYAHRYRARVYATVNTLLHDRELPLARQLVHQLWDAGVDAVIVQDLGLLELDLPPVPLFASTQLDNTTPERVAFLAALGFQRVILARELSIDEIRAVRAATTVPLEVFVHGALCVSYSGRCYLSGALGGRSANRGRCAQPCRLPWTLRDGEGSVLARDRHLLSLKDMDRSASLGDLLDAGVGSLKIEGRLKDERTIRNVVGWYRRALDRALEERALSKASSGRVDLGFDPDPRRSFHRGATDYFLTGRELEMSTPHSPKSTGMPVGVVKLVRAGWIELAEPHDLQPGDGLCFVGGDGVFRGTAVEEVKGERVALAEPLGLEPGVAISRNRDRAFDRALSAARPRRRIDVVVVLRFAPGSMLLYAQDEDGVVATTPVPHPYQGPRDRERAASVATAQLSRLGGSEFEAVQVAVPVEFVPHLPRSGWNELRRQLVQALREARLAAFPRAVAPARPDRARAPEQRLDFRANVINRASRTLLERCGVEAIEPGAEAGTELSGRPVMTTRFCLRYELERCPVHQGAAPASEPWILEGAEGTSLALRFDCARCEMQLLGPG